MKIFVYKTTNFEIVSVNDLKNIIFFIQIINICTIISIKNYSPTFVTQRQNLVSNNILCLTKFGE